MTERHRTTGTPPVRIFYRHHRRSGPGELEAFEPPKATGNQAGDATSGSLEAIAGFAAGNGNPAGGPGPGVGAKNAPARFTQLPPPMAVGLVSVPYTVQPGDTLFAIARRFEVPLARLRSANPEVSDDRIFSGQILKIPLREPTLPPLPEQFEPYVVQPGDTPTSIALQFGIPVDALLATNPDWDPEAWPAGALVFVPIDGEAAAPPLPAALYVVRPGDNLSSLARRFGVGLSDLRAANPGVAGDEIFPGEILVIPTRGVPSPPLFDRVRYIVQSGDTVTSIAQQFQTSPAQLEQVNTFFQAIPGLIVAVPAPIPIPATPEAPEGFPACEGPPFGRRLPLGDDDSAFVRFPAGFSFRFFGREITNGVFVNSNGNLTFGQGDAAFIPSTDAFLEGPPRIAPFWADLLPVAEATPGGVFVKETMTEDGRPQLVITWDRVPYFFARDLYQTFQVHLHPDGTISFCFFQVDPVAETGARVLVGVSGGATDPAGNVFLFDGNGNPRRLGPDEPTPRGGLTGRILVYTFDENLGNYRLRFS